MLQSALTTKSDGAKVVIIGSAFSIVVVTMFDTTSFADGGGDGSGGSVDEKFRIILALFFTNVVLPFFALEINNHENDDEDFKRMVVYMSTQ